MWEEDSDNNISDNALTLNLQAYGADGSACSSSEELCIDTGTEDGSPKQRNRKRKRSEEDVEDGDDEDDTDQTEEVDMPDVVHQMEAEIERQLDSKAKKSNLTVANVKNILKDVITNEHVLDLVRHTMKQPEKNFCISKVFSYAPKLTRAKTRELLNTFPSMAWPMTPSKNISNSKCKVLIEQELPEDSSGEEYQPDEDEDEKHKQDSSFCVDQDEDDEDEQAESDEADAQGDEDDDEEEDEIEEEQDSDKNDGNKIQLNVKPINVCPGGEDDDDIDDDEGRLVICDNDNDVKETPVTGDLAARNAHVCKHKLSKKAVINNTATQTSWPEVNGRKPQYRLVNSTDSLPEKIPIISEENICQRTRSKLSLSDTPLETIESAFIPPDITTDMYDSECDDEDWKNFLKGFTEPLKPDTQDAPDDDENDPEYNIMADEEETDDKEELREDPGVKVSRKEVNALMAELFEYIGMLSDENEGIDNIQKNNEGALRGAFEQRNEEELKDIAEHIAGALEQHTKESVPVETLQSNERVSTPVDLYPSPESISNEKETTLGDIEARSPAIDSSFTEVEVEPWVMPHEKRLLLEQQMRMYVQFQTQHFLLTYLHPLYHVYSMDCKQNLLVLKHHAKYNKSSTFYPVNLDEALLLVEKWEHLLSSEDAKRRYMDFIDQEIEMQNMMKRRKQFYRGEFPPGFFEIVCNSNVFIYPALLPTNPFRCDGHTTSPFFKSEDYLIALGLEHFMNYAKNNPKVLGKVSVPKIVPMIVEHFLPARRTSSVYTRILECTNSGNNPIRHFFQNNCAPKTTHYVLASNGRWLPPCQQPLQLLPEAWRDYIIPKYHSSVSGNM
ncbi:Uncharacterized protein GBIM_00809 [Gryllus bimaculatus]|nr:Uncharacterized protein GBIM_00809 [Gryllus bimaculatus]